MPSYLEAYRLSRAQAQEQQSPVSAENPDKTGRSTPPSARPTPPKSASSGSKTDISNHLTSQSFAAAKLSIDGVQSSNENKTSKEKVLRWRGSDDGPPSRVAGGASTVVKQADALEPNTLKKKTDVAATNTKTSEPTPAKVLQNSKAAVNVQRPTMDIRPTNPPKKRIVSDEHWLSDRTSPQPAQVSSPMQSVLPILAQTSLYARPGSKKPDAWVRRKSTPGRPNFSPTGKKNVSFEDGKDRDVSNGSPNAGGRVKETPEAKVQETPLKMESKANRKFETALNRSAPPKLGKSTGEDISPHMFATNETPRKGAWTRKRPPRRESFSSDVSTDDRDSGPDNAGVAPPKAFNGRLGAWLSQTPDPFVEKFDDPLSAATRPMSIVDMGSTIAPRKTSVRDDHRHTRRGQRVKSYSEAPSQSDGDDTSAESNPALKRSGARRGAVSPVRNPDSDYPSKTLKLAAAIAPKCAARARKQDAGNRAKANKNLASHADLISVLSQAHGLKGIVSARTIRTSRKKLGSATITDLMDELRSDEAKYTRELRTLVDGIIPVLLNSVLSEGNTESVGISFDDPNSKAKSKETIISLGIALERLHNMHKRIPTRAPVDFTDWAQRSQAVYENYIRAWKLGFQNVVVNLAPADSDPENENYVTKGRGERVDVAFLLKRPLVRLKYLAKLLKGIHEILSSELAGTLASKFQSLVEEARLKQDKEHARLEDEAASNIDPTKVRDPESLAPISNIRINRNRCVRARDVFDMTMHHSSGQRLDCHVMLFLRDDFSGYGNRGDVLISEVDSSSRWLLFPPAELPQLSARPGKLKREIVVMLRGSSSLGQEWRELMCLEASSEETATEWIKMLGSNPTPPSITTTKGFKDANLARRDPGRALLLAGPDLTRPPTPSEIDIPIGEQSMVSSEKQPFIKSRPATHEEHLSPSRYHKRKESSRESSSLTRDGARDPLDQAYSAPPSPHHIESSDGTRRADVASSKVRSWLLERSKSSTDNRQSGKQDHRSDSSDYAHMDAVRRNSSQRPMMSRRLSTVPSEGLLSIDKHRETDKAIPWPKPYNTQRPGPIENVKEYMGNGQSAKSSPVQIRGVSTPQLSPSTPKSILRRRSSSPLKYEYDPSSESDTSSVMADLPSDDDASVTSESSVDDIVPDPRLPTILLKNTPTRSSFAEKYTPKGIDNVSSFKSASRDSPQIQQEHKSEAIKIVASIYSWSDKGMWKLLHPDECSIVVTPGIIEAFEMSAAHSAPNHSSSTGSPKKSRRTRDRPLVALELTPLVPLRQSTAIDITIRSPPTANSQIRTGNNIMFRSRTGGECEILYGLINQARINNPTYVALQNARGPMGGSNWASYMDQQASKRGTSSWWRLGSKKSSYRAGNTRRSASLAETVSSVNSMSSAISALKRFSTGSNMFNVGKSTVLNRAALSNGRSTSSYESSSGSSTPAIVDLSQGSPAGLSDMKIRLYEREEASKWRDMGSARLTIMHPPRPNATLISPTGHLKQEKRVVIVGKTRGETLLDVTLGETSFERVARTGVAVKVWEQLDQMGKTGGVAGTRMRVYMIQMKSEAEAAYTFSLVGRLRY